jgi:hypothetical protein
MFKKLIYLVSLVLVLSVVSSAQTVKINFQLQGAPVPAGYLPDYGQVFGDRGNGWSYGWSMDVTGAARDRNNASAPDQRYDTLIHFQLSGTSPDKIWEIALENGTYDLFLVCGDPSNADSINTLDVEGTVVTDPDGPDSYDEYTVTVTVRDGRLTIKQAPDPRVTYAKICFIDITLAIPPGAARDPSPPDEATDVLRDVTLGWQPGETAAKHDVYLGSTFVDVNTATVGAPLNVLASEGQGDTTFKPAKALEFGTTYYWRVDEVNAPPTSTIYKGEVWSFTVEPYGYPVQPVSATASSFQSGMGPEKTIDGSGLTGDLHGTEPTTMWLTAGALPQWIQYEFDQVYKLHEVQVWNSNQLIEGFLGFGAKQVVVETSVDGTTWTPVAGVPEFGKAPGAPGYGANTTVALGDVRARFVKLTIEANWGGVAPSTGLSEVRFSYIPLQARAPEPATAATDVGLDTDLNWRPGREATSHNVFFGSDPEAVANGTAPAQTVTEHSYTPEALNLGTTYYWKVDEVGPTTYPGEIWSFTTQAFGIVDDFESYTDQPGEEVFSAWVDGFDNPAQNGSVVGLATAVNGTFCDTTVFHGGAASMPLAYDNTAAPLSEATLILAPAQDWTAHGVKSLSLWFQGVAGNGGQLYVKINDTKVPYNGNAADLAKPVWLPWNIDLSTVGGNLRSVSKLAIGIEGAGAKGTLYFDDIRLYPKTPEYIAPADPGPANLLGLWAFEGNANDTSGHGLNGTLRQAQLVNSGRPNGGSAVQVQKAGYVDLGNPPVLDFGTGDWTMTAWFKTAMTGTGDANQGTIYGKGGDNTGGHRYCLIVSQNTEGVITMVVDDNVTRYDANAQTKINDDQWHFVAGQREGTTLRIYIDGTLEGTTTIPAAYNLAGTVQHNAYIGAMTDNRDGSQYKLFSGLIDDVRIYNRALSAAEVLWLAGQTTPVAQPF